MLAGVGNSKKVELLHRCGLLSKSRGKSRFLRVVI